MLLTRSRTLDGLAATMVSLTKNIRSKLELRPVHDDARTISAVAKTITLSFANDPLIKWLRPLAPAWSIDEPNTFKWQYRRIQRTIAQGMVLQSAPGLQNHQHAVLPKSSESDGAATPMVETAGDDRGESDHNAAGVAVLLFPPASRRNWTVRGILLTIKLWVLDIFDPVPEEGTNAQRMETMMATHEESMGRIKMQYQVPNLWYLEVIAVDPDWQGRGVGKKAMCSVLELVQDEPIVLECTSETNISFYQRLGFEVVEEVELEAGDEAVKLWFMLRQTTNKGKCTPETVLDA